jgi:hypothetical protein
MAKYSEKRRAVGIEYRAESAGTARLSGCGVED